MAKDAQKDAAAQGIAAVCEVSALEDIAKNILGAFKVNEVMKPSEQERPKVLLVFIMNECSVY